MPVNILIADDHDIIREGIKSVLAARPEYKVCAEAANGEEALELVEQFKPDVLLLDVSMPKLSGLDVLARIKKLSPETKIIMITVHKMGAYVLKAIRAGVAGYINKENVAEELITALVRVLRGATYLGASISDYIAEVVGNSSKEELSHKNILTDRELDILRLVGEGKSAKEIAAVLCLSRRTVENYKNNMLKKLNLHKTSDLIRYALENKIIEAH